MNQLLRSVLPLFTGALVGAFGAILFQRSMPPQEGSPEERIAILENKLRRTSDQLRAWEDNSPRKRFGADTRDGARSIAKAIKEGRPVSPDDIFKSFKPLMRDLFPLTRRMQEIEIKRSAESTAGEYARKYGLTPAEQEQLISSIISSNTDQMNLVQNMLESDDVSFMEYMIASREMNRQDGVDEIMESLLKGEKREDYIHQRLSEKAEYVQSDADGQVQRISGIVDLDENQRNQMFLNMAQRSPHYDPRMNFEGLQGDIKPFDPSASREDAIMSVLRPDQKETYRQYRQERLDEARAEAAQLGLTIPDDWNMDEAAQLGLTIPDDWNMGDVF